jgi:hypothetical protein
MKSTIVQIKITGTPTFDNNQLLRCLPHRMICGGETVFASNYTGVLALCTDTQDIVCGQQLFDLHPSELPPQICRVSTVCTCFF